MQPSLFGEPERIQNYFYAFKPPPEIVEQIVRLQRELMRQHQLRGKPIRPELLHVTVCHLGEFEGANTETERKAAEAAQNLVAAPFTILFDRAASFEGAPSNRPFVLRNSASLPDLLSFQRLLHAPMAAAGLGKWAKPYTGHATLTYDGKLVPEQQIEPVSWLADELLLIRSPRGLTQHERLASWPLKG